MLRHSLFCFFSSSFCERVSLCTRVSGSSACRKSVYTITSAVCRNCLSHKTVLTSTRVACDTVNPGHALPAKPCVRTLRVLHQLRNPWQQKKKFPGKHMRQLTSDPMLCQGTKTHMPPLMRPDITCVVGGVQGLGLVEWDSEEKLSVLVCRLIRQQKNHFMCLEMPNNPPFHELREGVVDKRVARACLSNGAIGPSNRPLSYLALPQCGWGQVWHVRAAKRSDDASSNLSRSHCRFVCVGSWDSTLVARGQRLVCVPK